MKVSVSKVPMTGLMFGKGFLPSVRPKGQMYPVNVSNGMPIVKHKGPVIDTTKRRSTRKIGLVQR